MYISKWSVLSCAVALLFSGCISSPGSGGSELAGDGTGIGGTGFIARTKGETVGIRGRITGFGSILVNGVKIELTSATTISLGDEAASLRELATGQVVEVLAASDGALLTAADVRIRYEAVGPVDAAARAAGGISVMGQTVLFSGDTVIAGVEGSLPAAGTRIKVSGIRDGAGRILASRLEAAEAAEPDHLVGQVEAITPRGLLVSGLPVHLADASGPLPALNEVVTISGRFGADGFAATGWQSGPLVPFAGRATAVIIEGVPLPAGSGTARRLAGMPYVLDDRDNVLSGTEGGPVRIFSRLGLQGELRPVTMQAGRWFRDPGMQARPGDAPHLRQQPPMMQRPPMPRGPRR